MNTHNREATRINKTNSVTDKFTDFLGHYWTVTRGHTATVCGPSWDSDKKCRNTAYLFMFGAVNWFGQQNNMSIDDTLGVFALFFIKHIGLSAGETSAMLDELIFEIEHQEESLTALHSGQEAIVEFLADKPNSLNRLPALLVDQLNKTEEPSAIKVNTSPIVSLFSTR